MEEPEAAYAINSSFINYNTYQYDRQGSYTIEDYLALPDNQRAELIDGVIYDMGAPDFVAEILSLATKGKNTNYRCLIQRKIIDINKRLYYNKCCITILFLE